MIDDGKKSVEDEILLVFEEQYKKLFGMVYRMTESVQDTEDVLQNVFINAYKNINKFRGDSKLSTWLYRITMNECYSYLKSWSKLPVVRISQDKGMTEKEFFESIGYTQNQDDDLIIEEMREKCLQGFLRCIPQKMRACFLLKTCLELKSKEIAEVLDLSESNVKVLLHRGREKLKDMLEYRCNLINPDKPCKCYLWIKFMKERGLPLPEEGINYRNKELEEDYFKKMSVMKQIEFLYKVEHEYTYEEFLKRLQKLSVQL
ncbi:MAG: RNA polymerase sigma factor [Clostridiaceae bacterium]